MFGIALGVGASFVAAMKQEVRGWGILVSNIGAAIITTVTIPIAQSYGATWSNWLSAACVVSGICSGGVFLFFIKVSDAVAKRGGEAGDSLFARFFPKKDSK
jgi:hypothetical protein